MWYWWVMDVPAMVDKPEISHQATRAVLRPATREHDGN